MGIRKIMKEWPNIPMTEEQARLLTKIERNPIYGDVVSRYSSRCPTDYNPPEELRFGDICYWLDYEANMDDGNGEPFDRWRYSHRAVNSINRWLDEYSTYPIRAW